MRDKLKPFKKGGLLPSLLPIPAKVRAILKKYTDGGLPKTSYGPELITNGDFSSGPTGWVLGAGWSVSGGVATHSSVGGPTALTRAGVLTVGKTYRLRITSSSPTLFNAVFGATSVPINWTGNTGTCTGVCTTDGSFSVQGGGDIPVTGISVQEVIVTDAHLYTFGPGVPILGPELVVNGDFSNGAAGWTVNNSSGSGSANISGGALTIVRVDGSNMGARVSDAFPTIPGTSYQVSFDVANAPAWVYKVGIAGASYPVGRNSFSFVATATTTQLGFEASGNGSTTVIDNVGCKAITGYSNTYSGFVAGNYFDSAGPTQASVDGSVGLVLDAAGSVSTTELVTNGGPFAVTTGWTANNATLSVVSGLLRATTTATGDNGGYYDFSATTGKTYKALVTIKATSAATGAKFRIADTSWNGVYTSPTIPNGSTQTISAHFVANNANMRVTFDRVFGGSIGDVVELVSFSVKEVTGIHATQSTPGYKPTLRKGIVNVQPYSNDLTVAGWNATNLTKTAGSLTRVSTGSSAYCISPAIASPIPVGSKFTVAVRAKAKSIGGRLGVRGSAPYPNRSDGVFDLNTGTVVGYGNGGGFTGTTATIAGPDSSGHYMCAVSGIVGTASLDTVITGPTDASLGISGWEASSLVLSDVYVAASGIFTGTLTAQQILDAGGIPLTTTAPASPQAGSNYAEFDGVDDRLALGGLNSDTSGVLVVGATPKATGWRMLAGTGAQLGPNTGVRIGISGASNAWCFDTANGSAVSTSSTGEAVPLNVPAVVTGRWVQGGVQQLRVNGSIRASGSSFAVASTKGMAIGAGQYASTQSDFFNGGIHCVLAVKGTVSDADLAVLEKFVAQLSGVTL